MRMKWWKQCPLLLVLTVSGALFTIVSAVNIKGVYRDYQAKTAVAPVLAAVFQGAKDGVFPWTEPETAPDAEAEQDKRPGKTGGGQPEAEKEQAMQARGDGEAEAEQTVQAQGNGEAEAEQTVQAQGDGEAEAETDQTAQGDGSPAEVTSKSGAEGENSQGTGDRESAGREADEDGKEKESSEESEGREENRTYDFVRVEEDYFDDALFIGDSRTQGLYEYGGLEERAAFYCRTSLTVYDLFQKDKAFIKEDGETLTLTEALKKHQFGKIYLMVGINELGTGTPETFFEEYARAVYKIRELQPEAVIFVEGIMRVAAQKNAEDPIFNNTNINIRNVEIQTLADNSFIFYIDVNEAVCDENGNLFEEWTFDQIHLKAKYYGIWKEFLLDHGIVREQ